MLERLDIRRLLLVTDRGMTRTTIPDRVLANPRPLDEAALVAILQAAHG